MQGEAAGAAAAQVLQRADLDPRRGEGCAAGRGQVVVEADHQFGAEVSEKVRIEVRAEEAPTVGIGVISLAGCMDSVVIRLLEDDNAAWDESDDFAVDRAEKMTACLN